MGRSGVRIKRFKKISLSSLPFCHIVHNNPDLDVPQGTFAFQRGAKGPGQFRGPRQFRPYLFLRPTVYTHKLKPSHPTGPRETTLIMLCNIAILFWILLGVSALSPVTKPNPRPSLVVPQRVPTEKLLQEASDKFRAKTGNALFNVKQLEKEEGRILTQRLAEDFAIRFDVPKTAAKAARVFVGHESIQFILAAISMVCLFRIQIAPFSVVDGVIFVLTGVFWSWQEWIIHYNFFHGGSDFRAVAPFQFHDLHHDLPVFHVAIESLRTCTMWFFGISTLSAIASTSCGAPAALTLTFLASYTFFGLVYELLHFLAHSKVPLTGYLQQVRTNHIKHHVSGDTDNKYLSMSPFVDKMMGTGDK